MTCLLEMQRVAAKGVGACFLDWSDLSLLALNEQLKHSGAQRGAHVIENDANR